jgi:hypothetical protein
MNQVCHGKEPAAAGDAAIHLEFSWIATSDCVGLAMTNNGCSLAGSPGMPGETKQSIRNSSWIAAARFLLRQGYGGHVAHLAMTRDQFY